MHDCQKYRETLLEEVFSPAASAPDGLPDCEACVAFYQDATALANILQSEGPPEQPEAYWPYFEDCLRGRLRQERPGRRPAQRLTLTPGRMVWAASLAAAAGAGFFLLQASPPAPGGEALPEQTVNVRLIDDHISGLDRGTIDYLERSELFLRSFVKIEPNDVEDLEVARARARLQLAGLRQRREAAADFVPVRAVLENYESVLRDIHNLRETSYQLDLEAIQERIVRNGLIANMKAYQPQFVASDD